MIVKYWSVKQTVKKCFFILLQVTVYNMRFCPFAERTMLLLLAKNIPFDVVNINLKKKPEWFVGNWLA